MALYGDLARPSFDFDKKVSWPAVVALSFLDCLTRAWWGWGFSLSVVFAC
jgi:hypothetical protein